MLDPGGRTARGDRIGPYEPHFVRRVGLSGPPLGGGWFSLCLLVVAVVVKGLRFASVPAGLPAGRP
jgi:hypothetical protein